jgi:hypothetical protein
VADSIELPLQVVGLDLDEGELDRMGQSLHDELLTIDVDAVRPKAEAVLPPGARAGEAVMLSTLLVTVAVVLVGGVIDVVVSWLKRQTVAVEVELDGSRLTAAVTPAQRDAIVQAFLDRYRPKPEDR